MDLEKAELIQARFERLDTSIDNQIEVSDAIKTLCREWQNRAQGTAMLGQLGAPDWKTYELRIWELGESIRLFLQKKRGWRGRCALMDAIKDILLEAQFGKGRQTFALLLGDFGKGEYGEELASVLSQSEVCGHAIKALRKAKISGYSDNVREVFARESGWVKSAAKKYLQQFQTTV